MFTTKSPQVFVERLAKTAENIGKVPAAAANAGALIVKTSILAETERVAPGLRLRGTRGSGRIGVRYIPGSNSAGHAVSAVVATGAFQLIERDTQEHEIYPRGLSAKTARGRASGHRALAGVQGGSHGFGPYAHVHSRGTKGKHPFEKGVEAALPRLPDVLRTTTRVALVKELG